MTIKNITVSVDEETHRQARIRAAEMGTSVSALVRSYLVGLIDGTFGAMPTGDEAALNEIDRHRERLNRVIQEIKVKHPDFRAADRLPREQLYDRAGTGS